MLSRLISNHRDQGYVGYECLRKYCQAQGKMAGPAIAVIVAAPLLIWMVHSDIVGQ